MTAPRSGIFTPSELHRLGRRLDRRIASANTALTAMRQGQSLHLQYSAGRPLWSLSGGQTVSAEVADVLTRHASVVPVGDALFSDIPGLSQTWRYAK